MSKPYLYVPSYIEEDEATEMFHTLWNDLAWVQHYTGNPGETDPEKMNRVPRKEYWTNTFDRTYSYGVPQYARVYNPDVSHPIIDEIRNRIVEFSETAVVHEGCFLNGYQDGKDSLNWHTDDDSGIDHARCIISVTLYDGPVNTAKMIKHKNQRHPMPREMQVMPIGGTKADVSRIELGQGSAVIMKAGMQDTHLHRIPKAGFVCRPRISLTYRGLVK